MRSSLAFDFVPGNSTFIEDILHLERILLSREGTKANLQFCKVVSVSQVLFTQLNVLTFCIYISLLNTFKTISEKWVEHFQRVFRYLDPASCWNLSWWVSSRSSSSTTRPVRWPRLWKRSEFLNKSLFPETRTPLSGSMTPFSRPGPWSIDALHRLDEACQFTHQLRQACLNVGTTITPS